MRNEDIALFHHGIKGQRWGVRRFQNEDGTRTAAGRARERIAGSSGRTITSETTERKYKDVWNKGTEKRVTVTKTRIDSKNSGDETSRNLVDKFAKDRDYSEAADFDSRASYVLMDMRNHGKQELSRILDEELGNMSYEMLIEEFDYIDDGEKFVTYELKVFGKEYYYQTYGDEDYSDDQSFQKIKK